MRGKTKHHVFFAAQLSQSERQTKKNNAFWCGHQRRVQAKRALRFTWPPNGWCSIGCQIARLHSCHNRKHVWWWRTSNTPLGSCCGQASIIAGAGGDLLHQLRLLALYFLSLSGMNALWRHVWLINWLVHWLVGFSTCGERRPRPSTLAARC